MTENIPKLDANNRQRLAYEQELELREAIRHLQKFLSIAEIGKDCQANEIKTPPNAVEIYNSLFKLFREEFEEEKI